MSNKSRRAKWWVSGYLAGLMLAAVPAHAALIAYEGFDYAGGTDIRGQNGGVGWTSGWGGYDPQYTWPGIVTSAGLAYGGLQITGNALTTATTLGAGWQGSSALYWRNLPQFGQDGTTLYMSFLFRPEQGFGYYGGVNLNDDSGRGIFAGKSGAPGYGNYGLEGPLNDIEPSTVAVAAGGTVFVVLKAQFLAGNDVYQLFINPVLNGVEPATASATKDDFDPMVGTGSSLYEGTTLIFNNYGYYTIDEIRVGTTYADVTPTGGPIPEPGSLALLALGLAGLAGRVRAEMSSAAAG